VPAGHSSRRSILSAPSRAVRTREKAITYHAQFFVATGGEAGGVGGRKLQEATRSDTPSDPCVREDGEPDSATARRHATTRVSAAGMQKYGYG
jgi:hypothetical protein